MGSVPLATPAPQGHHARWSRRLALVGLGLLAGLGLLLAIIVLFAWPGEGGAPEAPALVTAGRVEKFQAGEPVLFQDHGFWLVRLQSGEFLALYEKDPHLGCTVPWRADFEFIGRKGWFRNPCHGETYDLTGRCFMGPCPRGLDRFPVRIVEGEIQVDMRELIPGPVPDPQAEPVNPPQQPIGR